MQGTWKESINGYSQKGCRRKKQKRKHTIKDKIIPILNKFHYKLKNNENSNKKNIPLRNEADKFQYIEQKTKIKQNMFVDVYIIKILNNYFYKETKHTKTVYKIGHLFYDLYTDEYITFDGDHIKILSIIDKKNILLDENKQTKKYNSTYKIFPFYQFEDELFLYGKPLPVKFHKIYGCYSTKRRKYVQKIVNKKDRAILKNWINKCEWDKPIQTHSLSKSIAWEIY